MLGLQLEAVACADEQLRQEDLLSLLLLAERRAAGQGKAAHLTRKGPVVAQDLLIV